MTKRIDTPRVMATKKNIRRVCALIAEGYMLDEATAEIGTTRHAWAKWCKRKPEVRAQYEQAKRERMDSFEDFCVTAHDDLTDKSATVPKIKLRSAQVDNRMSYLKYNNPAKFSEKSILGIQQLGGVPSEAEQLTSQSLIDGLTTALESEIPDDPAERVSIARKALEAAEDALRAAGGVLEAPVRLLSAGAKQLLPGRRRKADQGDSGESVDLTGVSRSLTDQVTIDNESRFQQWIDGDDDLVGDEDGIGFRGM